MNFLAKMTLAAALVCTGSAMTLSAAEDMGKNTANVEFRNLPGDFENLPKLEPQKWNFNFRPYGKEAAEFLWSDPNTIRAVASGEQENSGPEMTGLYVTCDEEGLNVMVFAAFNQKLTDALAKGGMAPGLDLETYILPGDADDQNIINYHPFGYSSNAADNFDWSLSWMTWDRNVRPLIPHIQFTTRNVANGMVVRMHYPWLPLFDRLPIFSDKKDNFWRLAMMRWAATSITWGGVVHQQIQLGYLRMPEFTQEQKTKIMKNTLLQIWKRYQNIKNARWNNPNTTSVGRGDLYRESQKNLPHSYMNVNEDYDFEDAWLLQAIKDRDALGAKIAEFEKLSPAEQEAFYKKNAALLYNFDYDIEEAYADYLNKKIMKR